eukprot:CAMPEP_0181223838 /NCGR_PEP_ID=MMETSP1096-20121128/30773_1 /TAXON_ID=156174 ORGANISM="Chrysochromulina ericina, Strain CCMP281" /NCGR_SAMPLE_ID=MMETSP1096 /ASSEMBLY_ACC=CAM_ASM_000453 /LENGTH=65 /DNA_ID=CAMNT_0023316813 /DNA_START=174 /DNA_END=370 /DNA_ORIENTATION=+
MSLLIVIPLAAQHYRGAMSSWLAAVSRRTTVSHTGSHTDMANDAAYLAEHGESSEGGCYSSDEDE